MTITKDLRRPSLLHTVFRHGWGLAALLALLIFLPTLAYRYTFDDSLIVVGNPRIRDLRAPARYLATSWWDSPTKGREYRPAVMAGFALNYAAGGLNPVGYHAVNIALHAAIAALLWLLLMRLFRRPGLALAAALIFAIHPVHIEAVAGVVGRAELQVTFFFLLALLAAHASMRAGRPVARAGWAGAVWLAAVGAVFSKEHGVMLLPVLPLLALIPPAPDEWPSAANRAAAPAVPPLALMRRRAARLVPAIAAVGAAIVLYFIARKLVLGAFLKPAGDTIDVLDNALVMLTGPARRLAALNVVARYGLLLVAPFNPSPDYSYKAIDPAAAAGGLAWAPGLLLLMLAVMGFFMLRRRPAPLFGLCFLVITFLVASNLFFLIGTIMAERLLYLPSVGFCILLAALIVGEGSPAAAPTRGRRAALWALGGWGALLLVQHFHYLPVWRSDATLFAYMGRRVPLSARAHGANAIALANQGRYAEALEEARRANNIYPHLEGMTTLGEMYLRLGQAAEARQCFERVYINNTTLPKVNYYLATLLARDGQAAQGERILRRAIAATRQAPDAVLMLAIWLSDQGRCREALPLLEREWSRSSQSNLPQANLALARCWGELGRPDDAVALLDRLLKAFPKNNEAALLLGQILARQGRRDRAETLARQVLASDPGNTEALKLLKPPAKP